MSFIVSFGDMTGSLQSWVPYPSDRLLQQLDIDPDHKVTFEHFDGTSGTAIRSNSLSKGASPQRFFDGLLEAAPHPSQSRLEEGSARGGFRPAGHLKTDDSKGTYSVIIAFGPEDVDEGRALKEIASGDPTAFWSIWDSHRTHLYKLCLRHMKGVPEDAEDLLSTIMLRALDRLPAYASRITCVRAWLTRLAQNLCLDVHRGRRRTTNKLRRFEEGVESGGLVAASTSPEQILFYREIVNHLIRMIDNLPERLREPFILRFWHDMSYVEIAAHLDLSEPNVRKRIQQARDQLGQGLASKCGLALRRSSRELRAAKPGRRMGKPVHQGRPVIDSI